MQRICQMLRFILLLTLCPFLQSYKPYDLQRMLWNAVSNGNVILTRELLAQGADPTVLLYGRSYLEIAAQNSLYRRLEDVIGLPNPYVPVIEALLECGADPNQLTARLMTPYDNYEACIMFYPHPDIHRLLA